MTELKVCDSSFDDWILSFRYLNSRIQFIVNIHPITHAKFFDLNSIIIDGKRVGEKLADHLLKYGFSLAAVELLNSIYETNMLSRIPLRMMLSFPTVRIISPYFNISTCWHIAFDKTLTGRLLFIYTDDLYVSLPAFIQLLFNDIQRCSIYRV